MQMPFTPQVIWSGKIGDQGKLITDQCDCNCACASSYAHQTLSSIANNGFVQRSAALRLYPLNQQYSVAYDTLAGTVAAVDAKTASFLDSLIIPQSYYDLYSTYGSGTKNAVLNDLISLGFLTSANSTVVPSFESICSPKEPLIAWLHMTDNCNLRCSYCYLSHNDAKMTIETGRAVVAATFRSAQSNKFPSIKLKYSGGEPLLCFDTIVNLHKYAKSLADQTGVTVEGVILSNGTLLNPKILEVAQTLNIRLMISLDGLHDFHDGQRSFINGRGSYDLVAKAIDLALSYGLIPDISITISGRNLDGLPDLIRWVLHRDLPFGLNFYRYNPVSASQTDLLLTKHLIEKILESYKIIESQMPRRSLVASLADRANLAFAHSCTCGVGRSYLVFDCAGRVAKCQMDMNHKFTDASDPDPLMCIRESKDGINNLTVDEKIGCKNCEWRYWCTGGCPLQTYRLTGRYDITSPNCDIYKALFPEIIRLEGLRLLTWFGGPCV